MKQKKRRRADGGRPAAKTQTPHTDHIADDRASQAVFPPDVEAMLDLWNDTADRFLCAAWWRLSDGVGLDDLEDYRLSRVHFATADQWSIAQALTAASQFGVRPTLAAIHDLGTAAGCTYSHCELQEIRYIESTSVGIHRYVAMLLDFVRRHAVLVELDKARLRLLNPTVPTGLTVGELKAKLAQDMAAGLPEPPPLRLPAAPAVPVRVRRVG